MTLYAYVSFAVLIASFPGNGIDDYLECGSAATSGVRAVVEASALDQSELTSWLIAHPEISSAIKWQFKPGDVENAMPVPQVPWAPAAPREPELVAWPDWSAEQKSDLEDAYQEIVAWHAAGAKHVNMVPGGPAITDAPLNLNQEVSSDITQVSVEVSGAYMWKLYTAHVAFSLWIEITRQVPWTITDYDKASLRYLLDSSTMGWELANGSFVLGNPYYSYTLRSDNLPQTVFADPRWVYRFMADSGIVQNSRLKSIAKLLEWMRDNMRHMLGDSSFGRCEEIWQYRGYPPFSKIVNGTIDAENANEGVQHWTAGCHSSVGFMNAALRTLNIPVQPVEVCGHRIAAFLADKRYLSHGDLPYNQDVQSHKVSGDKMLIDEATFQSWFGANLDVNISDREGCEGGASDNIGRLPR